MGFLTTTLARVLYGLPFAVFGFNHFMYAQQMTGMVPSFMPFKIFWVYLTGAALIAAAISIISTIHIRLASLLLALMLFIFVAFIHLPGVLNQQTMQMAMAGLLKDLSLAGAALFIAGKYGK